MGMSKFITCLYEMAINEENSRAIGFSPDGLLLELRDFQFLSQVVLLKYFKSGSITSFIRQLHNYSFKTKPVRPNCGVTQCFAHPDFIRGQPDLCVKIVKQHPQAKKLPTNNNNNNKSSSTNGDLSSRKRLCEADDCNSSNGSNCSSNEDSESDESVCSRCSTSRSNKRTQLSYEQLEDATFHLAKQNVELLARVSQLEHLLSFYKPANGGGNATTVPPPPPTAAATTTTTTTTTSMTKAAIAAPANVQNNNNKPLPFSSFASSVAVVQTPAKEVATVSVPIIPTTTMTTTAAAATTTTVRANEVASNSQQQQQHQPMEQDAIENEIDMSTIEWFLSI